ncbi:MAG: phosphoglycerate dehydrogenase, partial [Gordonia sp. (in: high G+C Gram-positive bacteria)]
GVLVGVVADGVPTSLTVEVRGELAALPVNVLGLSAVRGLFSAVVDEPVTFVNAPSVAAERGLSHEVVTATESPNHRSLVDVRAVFADGSTANVAGTLTEPREVEKIVNINGRNFDLRAEGINLIASYTDQPGSLGKIGTLLGNAAIDIEAAALSQDREGDGATIVLRVNTELSDEVLSTIGDAVSATLIKQVDLS